MFLPDADEQYEAIRNAVALYNNRLSMSIVCDDITETVDRVLSDSEKLIIANYIKLVLLRNVHTFKSSILYTFTKEVGVKDVQAQLKAAQFDVQSQEEVIDRLIFYNDDSSIM